LLVEKQDDDLGSKTSKNHAASQGNTVKKGKEEKPKKRIKRNDYSPELRRTKSRTRSRYSTNRRIDNNINHNKETEEKNKSNRHKHSHYNLNFNDKMSENHRQDNVKNEKEKEIKKILKDDKEKEKRTEKEKEKLIDEEEDYLSPEFNLNANRCCNGINWKHVKYYYLNKGLETELPLTVVYGLFCLWRYKRCKNDNGQLLIQFRALNRGPEIISTATTTTTTSTTSTVTARTTIFVVFLGYEDWSSIYHHASKVNTPTKKQQPKRRKRFTHKKKVKKKPIQDAATLKIHSYLVVPVALQTSTTEIKNKKRKKIQ